MHRSLALLSLAALAAPILLIAVDANAQGQDDRRGRGFERPGGSDRARQGVGQGRNQGQDPLGGRVQVGSTVPGFTELVAVNPDGSEAVLSELVPEDGKLVLVTGCLTCPKFLISYRDIEAVAHDHRSAGGRQSGAGARYG